MWTETHMPCPCGKSTDAYSVNDEGWGTCFSCGDRFPPDTEGSMSEKPAKSNDLPMFKDLQFRPLTKRGLTQDTCQAYQYGINGDGHQVAQFYDEAGRLVAQQIRRPDKSFQVRGDMKAAEMFGSRLLQDGGKMVVITEGAVDALSVFQAMGHSWPVLSLKQGAQAAARDVSAMIQRLEKFDKVVLAFDADEPGQAAVEAAASMLSPGRAHIMDYGGYKDANELLVEKGEKEVRQAVWHARPWRPDGVINLSERRSQIRERLTMGRPFPWAVLNDMTFGYRPGEIVTWTAGTGVGKTALVSEVAYHAAFGAQDPQTLGLIYLEEGVDRAGKRLVGIHMNLPLHLPGAEYTDEDFDKAFDETLGTERLYAYDHFGSLDGDVLMNRIRYMTKHCGCETIVLDHISIVVSGNDLEEDERRTLDRLMTRLRSMTQETGVSLHLVSHLRRPPGSGSHEEGRAVSLAHLRGTQAIAQLSDTVIAAERDQQADDEDERNTTTLRVLKNRYAGRTGPADRLYYSLDTGRLTPTESIPAEKEKTHDDY